MKKTTSIFCKLPEHFYLFKNVQLYNKNIPLLRVLDRNNLTFNLFASSNFFFIFINLKAGKFVKKGRVFFTENGII